MIVHMNKRLQNIRLVLRLRHEAFEVSETHGILVTAITKMLSHIHFNDQDRLYSELHKYEYGQETTQKRTDSRQDQRIKIED